MAKKSSADALIAQSAKDKGDREKTSLYLSKSLYEAFKKKCGKAAASRVLEELIREFIHPKRGSE